MAIKDLVVTDMNCRNDTVMGAERAFLNNLKGTTAYIQSDDKLLLVNDRGDSLLTYDTKAVFP
jgi:heat shock protein HslJ